MKKLISLLFLISMIILTGCGRKTENPEKPANIEGQNIIVVKKSVIDDYYETSGLVKAQTISNIASKILARVDAVNVEEGDPVKKGQLLVVMDNNDILAKVRSAEAAYNEAVKNRKIAKEEKKLAETTYERYKNIYEEKALTGQELDEATARRNIAGLTCKKALESMNRAKAVLDEAKTVLGYSKLYAPISGIVTDKNIDTGDTAAPGQILLTVKDINNLEIVSEVDESYIDTVKKASPIKILAESTGKKIDALISEVVNSVDTVSRSFKIKVKLAGSGLNDGQYVTVAIPVGKRENIMIPVSAVVKKGQLEGVYSADKRFKLIKTGKTHDDMIEVLSGLENGEEILWKE